MVPSVVGLLGVGVLGVLWYFWHAHASTGGVRRGFASAMDIVENLSPTHARRKALRTRPITRVLWWTPLREVGIELGRTLDRPRRTLATTVEDVILYVAGPRTGKSGALACHVQNAPGAVLVTSTRPDQYRATIGSRRLRPVWVFNPREVGGVPTAEHMAAADIRRLRWSPVLAAYDVERAWLIAASTVEAGDADGRKDAKYWAQHATRALRLLLAAAHVGGVDMHTVHDWISALAAPGTLDRPIAMLDRPEGRATFPGWSDDLRALSEMNPKPLGSIGDTLTPCVQYMADPQLAYAATPGPAEHFTPERFLATGGTLYVIGAHEEHSPVGPLFSTFIGYLYEHARRAAAASPGERLDPPLTMVLDEAYATFRVPLPRWTSDAGGYGIPIVVAIQGYAQLVDAFGKEGAEIIWQNATTKITLGGQMDPDTVRNLSVLCGERAGEVGAQAMVPVLRPDEIKNLREFVAVILHRGIPPVMARIPMVWERKNPPVAEPLALDDRPSAEIVLLDDRRPDKVA